MPDEAGMGFVSRVSPVQTALRKLRRDLKVVVKEVNSQAARKLAQGNYAASQEMVALAKAVQQFAIETKELQGFGIEAHIQTTFGSVAANSL
jgi:hypothetical protein